MPSTAKSLAKFILAGPCSAEDREQVLFSAGEAKKIGVHAIRACLWKPRTKPGFDGVGEEGINWLLEAAVTHNIAVGTEILIPEHVSLIAEKINKLKEAPEMIMWIGARNQNHLVQQEIARRAAEEMPTNTRLMLKNQPWIDTLHWVGIVEHVISVGFPKERISLIHRGFAANRRDNPSGYRNLPDHEEAMRVKEITNLPMLLDPSHIGGSIENVMSVIKEGIAYNYDGMMIEVHPTPADARTDAKQQLSFPQLEEVVAVINHSQNGKSA